MTITIESEFIEIVRKCPVTGWVYRDEISRKNAANMLIKLINSDCVIIRKDA